jgi:hypothetical protein
VSYALLRLADYLGKSKFDFLAVSKEAFAIMTRQSGKQAILRRRRNSLEA